MASSIGSAIGSFTPYIPDLADTANIQTALKLLYFGSTAASPATDGLYGALKTLYEGTPTLAGSVVTLSGDIAVNGGDITSSATTFNLLNSTVTTLNIGGAGTAVSIGATTGTTTVKNTLTLGAGTTSKAPLVFTSGNNTAPTLYDGAIEYDGKIFYATPKVNNSSAGRGVISTPYVLALSTTPTDSVSSSTSSNKTSATLGKYIYLAANTTYRVEFSIKLYYSLSTSSSGTSSISFRFALPTGATIGTDLQYRTGLATIETSTSAPTVVYETSAIDLQLTSVGGGSSSSKYAVINGTGVIRMGSTAGNVGPTFYLAVNGGGVTASSSFTTQSDSYCIIEPIGGTGDINQGGWA